MSWERLDADGWALTQDHWRAMNAIGRYLLARRRQWVHMIIANHQTFRVGQP